MNRSCGGALSQSSFSRLASDQIFAGMESPGEVD